ncbi:MAG TPA: hypothetical protein PKA37_11445 [Planctomycetota bacterium]|jgi:hypothetical protein|nr:hypothetical protein [Planctomycetota bacterium]
MRSSVSGGEIRRTASELYLKVIVTRWVGVIFLALMGSLAAQKGSEPVADEGVLLQQSKMSELVVAWQELGKLRCGDDQPAPAASHAVVPTTGQKLEMHRVVSFVDQGKWCGFDPSLVHDDVTMHPRQVVVMGCTTIDDEHWAMMSYWSDEGTVALCTNDEGRTDE